MRMKAAAEEAKVAEPEFELDNFFRVSFKRTMEDASIGRQSVANRSQPIGMTDKKQIIIRLMEKKGQVRVSELINIIGLSDGRVRALLRQMAKDGTIEKIGKNRYAYYVLKKNKNNH